MLALIWFQTNLEKILKSHHYIPLTSRKEKLDHTQNKQKITLKK